MSTDIIQAKYEDLAGVARRLAQQSQASADLRSHITRSAKALEQGGWIGRGSTAFFSEMNSLVFPALQRLIQALEEARAVTLQASEIMRIAEQEASGLFKGDGVSGLPSSRGSQGEGGGFWGGVGDFFTGIWKEGKDTVLGLVNMVIHPIETAKGIAHAVTHPSEFWEAFKQPYVEAWENGRPWEAVGRGVMFVGSALVGTKGADKVSKFSKASRMTQVTAEAAEVGRLLKPVEAASELGRVTVGSSREAALARYIAEKSTHKAGTVERVVIGSNTPNPLLDFPGYIKEAETKGGIYYNTSGEVWDVIKPDGGHGNAWPSNAQFLQSQLENGVPRIELKGATVTEVINDPFRKESFTGKEINHLKGYAYEYGYKFSAEENAWIKVGEWRASHVGRAVGAGTGAGASLLDEAQALNPDNETPGRLP